MNAAIPDKTAITACLTLFSCLLIVFCLSACTPPVTPKDDRELGGLLDVVKKQGGPKAEPNKARLGNGIRMLTVEKVEGKYLVSVDLDEAWVATVVEGIFAEAGVPYSMDKTAVSGRVSASLRRTPLLQAIRAVLAPTDAQISAEKDIIVITGPRDPAPSDAEASRGTPAESPAAESRRQITREVQCRNTDISRIIKAVGDFFPHDAKTTTLRFSQVPNTNSILLTGKADEVRLAVDIVQRLDKAPHHVIIDAAVIEVDEGALLELGIDIMDAATGQLRSLTSNFGSLTDVALTFSLTKATNPKALTAAIDFLVTKDRARLISRPYTATMSGEKATINITNDRYVIVQSSQDGATVSTNLAVPSGVMMEIIPRVVSDNTILMNISVEDSSFVVNTPKNVAVEVDKNRATTVMQVDSGDFIIIGGLILDRSTVKNSGFPYLRDLPGLNLLFGKTSDTRQKQETLFLVRPRIWKAGEITPVITDQKSLIMDE